MNMEIETEAGRANCNTNEEEAPLNSKQVTYCTENEYVSCEAYGDDWSQVSGKGMGWNLLAWLRNNVTIRQVAIQLSLYANLIITATKLWAYISTRSLSVLAALLDSILEVVSQLVLAFSEHHSNRVQRSSALYPAGAARVEPIGVLICASLMGMGSFEVLKESTAELLQPETNLHDLQDIASFWSMFMVVFVKIGLLIICNYASRGTKDSTMAALALDHLNDALSNGVAAIALLAALTNPSLWFIDPVGAILISLYIIWSWWNSGKEQIDQLMGFVAPEEFIQELREIASSFDSRLEVDVCRAYHFGPKFLVELEVILPRDMVLQESHDLGMDLQYEIESREEVERCFVHIDYEARPYDEHVVSKVPEIRENIRRSLSSTGSASSNNSSM